MKRITKLLGAGILLLCSMAYAVVPQLINFQGILRDGSGNPVANGSYSVDFTIYDAATGGTNLWSETQSVNTVNGLFTVLLGSGPVPLADSVFRDSTRWLGVKVGADPEMTPRQRLSSVGYSHNSSEWTSAGQNLFRLNGNVGIGTASPFAKLDVLTLGSYGISASGSFTGVNSSGGVYGVAASGGTYGVYGSGNSYGVYGYSSGGAAAVYGDIGGNFGTYGGYFQGDVRVERTLVVTGGVNATSAGADGIYGSGTNNGVNGYSAGGNGVNALGGTRGVYAEGASYGVVASGTAGIGIYAVGGNGGNFYGSTSAVYAEAIGSGGGSAIVGNAGGAGGWAGLFTGDVSVSGWVFKGGGGFKIDHPTDPANKYLYHSFVESPDMKNIYDGVVTLDAKGEATVTLPDWFGAVNGNFRYQLTAIGAPGPNLHIAEEISRNQFRIAGGTSGMKVSWQVTGIRKDVYAEAHRIPVEEVKPAKERGKYLHPKDHGVSETLGMSYEMTQKSAAERKQMEEQQAKMTAERKQHEEQRAKMEQERLIQEQKIKENQPNK